MSKSNITQRDAYDIYLSKNKNCSDAVRQMIKDFALPEEEFESLRWKIRNLQKSRATYIKKNDLEVWENISFCSLTTETNFGSQMSIDTLETVPVQTSFIEENHTDIRKPLLKLTMKAARTRLSELLQHIQFVALREQVDENKVAALAWN